MFRVALAAFLLLVAAACSREAPDVSQSPPSPSSTGSGTPAESPPVPRATATPHAAAAPTQEVHLIEYAVHMPATLNAGRVAFNIENGGKETHGFEIEGNGIHQKTNEISRGEGASLEVDLKPGMYTVWCPVKDHAQKGMKTTITVR